MKKNVLVTLFILSLILVIAVPVAAGGPTDKATGSGTWTNGQSKDFYAEFNAHEPLDNRPAKGMLYQSLIDNTGAFTVDVDAVEVYSDLGYACFGGNTVEASGEYANYLNHYRWTVVVDGGEGLDAMDYLRGSWTNTRPSFCENGNPGANEAWSGGNVQIHAGKSYE